MPALSVALTKRELALQDAFLTARDHGGNLGEEVTYYRLLLEGL
jgi:hypothetical protein